MTNKKEITEFGFITFDIEQIDEIVKQIGLHFNKNNYLVDGNNSVKCSCCNHSIRKRNLGNILPGSNIIYCDNPVCFAEYMNEQLNL